MTMKDSVKLAATTGNRRLFIFHELPLTKAVMEYLGYSVQQTEVFFEICGFNFDHEYKFISAPLKENFGLPYYEGPAIFPDIFISYQTDERLYFLHQLWEDVQENTSEEFRAKFDEHLKHKNCYLYIQSYLDWKKQQ